MGGLSKFNFCISSSSISISLIKFLYSSIEISSTSEFLILGFETAITSGSNYCNQKD